MPNLRIRDAGREYTFQIAGEFASLGRGDTNDIDIEDAKASKEHCRIERVGQRWKLVDLESKNGTKVNGAFKNKAWLGHGDLVQIGTAELRFGLEGTSRAPAGAAAPPRRARSDDAGETVDDGEEEELPVRRYRPKTNLVLLASLGSAGLLLLLLLSTLTGGSNNALVLKEGEKYVESGDWGAAIQYMEQHGEPDEDDYVMIERRLKELRELRAGHERNVREQEAKAVLSKVGNLILSYNKGHIVESSPDKILPLMRQLREKYPGTEASEYARKEYPAWWADKVPQPASELLSGGGQLRRDWDAAVERSETFRRERHFREAKEAIERFVTDREALLGAGDLATYEQLRDEQLATIDRLAESVYHGSEAEAERLIKNKRYDDAIAVYQKIVEKFGIDVWVRRAQAEIGKIQKMKAGGG